MSYARPSPCGRQRPRARSCRQDGNVLAGSARYLKTAAMADPIFADPLAWRTVKAPSLEELETLAETAFHRLPQKFRALCEGLVIRVEDFPTEEVMDEL